MLLALETGDKRAENIISEYLGKEEASNAAVADGVQSKGEVPEDIMLAIQAK